MCRASLTMAGLTLNDLKKIFLIRRWRMPSFIHAALVPGTEFDEFRSRIEATVRDIQARNREGLVTWSEIWRPIEPVPEPPDVTEPMELDESESRPAVTITPAVQLTASSSPATVPSGAYVGRNSSVTPARELNLLAEPVVTRRNSRNTPVQETNDPLAQHPVAGGNSSNPPGQETNDSLVERPIITRRNSRNPPGHVVPRRSPRITPGQETNDPLG